MAKITETETYTEEIDLLARGDVLEGGASGVANMQAKQLANRTKWLKVVADEVIAARDVYASLALRLGALITSIGEKVAANAAIAGSTKTKVTYDSKGLVTAGADATTADIADSSNKRYVTDAEKSAITHGNRAALDAVSGINTGDQDIAAMAHSNRASLDLVSGTNTGDQTNIAGNAATATKLETARAINGTNFDGSAAITIYPRTENSVMHYGDKAIHTKIVGETFGLGQTVKTVAHGITNAATEHKIIGVSIIFITSEPIDVLGMYQTDGSYSLSETLNKVYWGDSVVTVGRREGLSERVFYAIISYWV